MKNKQMLFHTANGTFVFALNIYYKINSIPKMQHREFDVNTSKNRQISLSISSENSDENIDLLHLHLCVVIMNI